MALQDFYLGYMHNALQPGEFVEAVRVPAPQAGETLAAYKVSKRFDSDISAVACGLWLRLDDDCMVQDARFAYGGMAAIVKRADGAEAAVRGQPWTAPTLDAAMQALQQDFQPLTDLRASAAYRRLVAANLLRRFWLATRAPTPLAAGQLHVMLATP